MNSEKIINPILKWAGGKRQLIPELKKYIPTKFNKYIEPFFGGGALFFHLAYDNSIINDTNPEIINLYQEISKRPKLIIEELEKYKNNEKFFYALRNSSPKTSIKKAARTIFLNRTCFNGLYRVNKKGQFNVPYGKTRPIKKDCSGSFLDTCFRRRVS